MLLIVPLLSLPDSYAPGIARDDHQKEGFRQIAVIGAEYRGVKRIRALYEEGKSDTDRVVMIYALEDASYAPYMLDGHGAVDQGEFRAWERNYHSVPNPDGLGMTRLVAIGKDVVVEAVNHTEVSRTLLSGHDPMLFRAAGESAKSWRFIGADRGFHCGRTGAFPWMSQSTYRQMLFLRCLRRKSSREKFNGD